MYRLTPLFLSLTLVGCFPEVELKDAALNDINGPDDEPGDDPSDPDVDGDGYPASQDCDDDNAAISPAADEVCDGVDNNCDGEIDPDSAVDAPTWYADGDSDGFGDPDSAVTTCEQPEGTVLSGTDCDDGDAAIHPEADEVCDDIDNDCDALIDGEDDSIDPALLETFWADDDDDGFGDPDAAVGACERPDGFVDNDTDCDDGAAEVNPDAAEVCDDIDNDCDDRIDDDDDDVDPSTYRDFYPDSDGDGYGEDSAATLACSTPSGFAETNDDCDDGNADVNPGETEVCDEGDVDEDCSGTADDDDPGVDTSTATDWYPDADGDGYGSDSATAEAYCDDPSTDSDRYVTDNTDCDDARILVNPAAAEVCDDSDFDEDCNGLADDDDPGVSARSLFDWTIDADGDTYGDQTATPVQACEDPSTATDSYVVDATDCDDTESGINPGATEVCDADDTDEDCDGLADDADPSVDTSTGTTWYPDSDGDGYGSADATGEAFCDDPASGYYETADDCDDDDAAVNPGATEVCNDKDDDCDATTGQAGMAQFVDTSGTATDLQSTLGAGSTSSLASWTSSTDGTLWVCEGTWYTQLEVDSNHTVDIIGPDGSAVTVLDGNYIGLMVYLAPGSDVTMTGLTIQSGYDYNAGGMLVDQSTFSGTDLVFTDNFASFGGAVTTNYADVRFESTTFSGNGSYYGGAVLAAGNGSESIELVDCTFEDNDSYEDGGGLYLYDSPDVSVTGSTFTDNYAANDGAGVYVEAGFLLVEDCVFDSNDSDHDGGGIYAADEIEVVDSQFIDNYAYDDGGGIYLTLGRYEDASITGTIGSSGGASTTSFSGNAAGDNGESVYLRIADDWYDGGTLSVDSVDFNSDDFYNRTYYSYSWFPGNGASFSCTYWFDCF